MRLNLVLTGKMHSTMQWATANSSFHWWRLDTEKLSGRIEKLAFISFLYFYLVINYLTDFILFLFHWCSIQFNKKLHGTRQMERPCVLANSSIQKRNRTDYLNSYYFNVVLVNLLSQIIPYRPNFSADRQTNLEYVTWMIEIFSSFLNMLDVRWNWPTYYQNQFFRWASWITGLQSVWQYSLQQRSTSYGKLTV